MKDSSTSRKLYGAAAILSFLLFWEVGAHWLAKPLLLPTPAAALWQAWLLFGTPTFWAHLATTISRGLLGFGLAFISGVLIGLPAGRRRSWEAFFRPLIAILRSTPSMSLIILALIWMRSDQVPVFVTFLVVFPIIIQNVIDGMRQISPNLLAMAQVFRLGRMRRITKLYLPSLLPFLAAAIATGLGFTWKVLIAAEVLAYPAWGVGAQLDTARTYLQTDLVFAWTLVVMVIGLSFDYLLAFLMRKPFEAWRGAADE
jgi:NitT/TauT family transport system permease protein